MPNALFYQPSSGLSGDMHLAALLDLGVPAEWLNEQLNRLPVAGQFELEIQPAVKMGISGTQVRVHAQDQHHHRHHSTIVNMIRKAGYPAAVEQRALAMFAAIAKAEAKIHNIDVEAVHFHEVGAIDSIVDIVGAALCIDYFTPTTVLSNPVEVGSGFVNCAHGRFPVPAPATQELLAGMPCTYGTVQGEATTPTGAAILAVNAVEHSPKGMFTPHKIGYGIGHKDFDVPNVVRVVLGDYAAASHEEQHVKIEANIDDMTPEALAPLAECLFSAGAVDVYFTPILMKKGRPAQCISALCHAAEQQAVSDALLNHSSTIGLRVIPFAKQVLPRVTKTFTTSLGEVQIKEVTQPDGRTRWKSEHTDILRIAEQHDLDYQQAKTQTDFEIQQQLTTP
ncbi:MAG: nickel pincer cofactor biosynthesis protein LarC [Pseudomonadota bacterium]